MQSPKLGKQKSVTLPQIEYLYNELNDLAFCNVFLLYSGTKNLALLQKNDNGNWDTIGFLSGIFDKNGSIA